MTAAIISLEQAKLDRMIDVPMDQLVAGFGRSPAQFIAELIAAGELPRGFQIDEAEDWATWTITGPDLLDGLPLPHLHPAYSDDLFWSTTVPFDGSDLRRRLMIDQASRTFIALRVAHVDSVRLRDATRPDDRRAEAIGQALGIRLERVADALVFLDRLTE